MQVTNSETRLPMQSQIVSVGAAKPGTDRANRVQPANSKGGNWWQSPLCGAHTDRHFRESLVCPLPSVPCRHSLHAPAVVFDGFFDGVVLFGETHELQADGIDEGFPTGVDDVLGDTYGGPTAAVVAPLDEDADIGGGAFAGIEDADFVIGEADVGDLRIEPGKALAQADVQGVEGAMTGFGGAV